MIAIILIVISVIYALLAGFIAASSRHRASWIFAFILACFAAWSFGMFIFIGADAREVALSGATIFYIAAVLFAPLFLIFALEYPVKRNVSKVIYTTVAVEVVTMVALLAYDISFILEIADKTQGQWNVEVNLGGYLLFSLHFVAYFIAAVCLAIWTAMRTDGLVKQQAFYYMLGILLTSLPGFVVDLILPAGGDYRYIWLGPICSIAFLALTLFSMNRYRMLNVKAFVAKGMTYISLMLSIVFLYVCLLYVISRSLVSVGLDGIDKDAIYISIAIIAAFTFQPMKVFFDKMTQQLLYRRNYDIQRVIDELTKACVIHTDLDGLSNGVFVILQKVLNPRYMVIVFDSDRAPILHNTLEKKWMDAEKIASIDDNVSFVKYGIAAIHRLKTASQDIGYLIVGEEFDERVYRDKDLKVIRIAADEISIAIQNIQRLEEIRRFADTLEKEVSEATRELRQTNKKLVELDATKDEFISMASHQLRTPLTSIKGYLSMVLEGDVGKVSASQRKLLNEAFVSSERMVHLIGDFLNVSRLQTGKFMLEIHQVDFAKVVAQEVEGMRSIAAAHNVTIRYDKPPIVPILYIDEGKLRQVIMNFIDNAIYYSPDAMSIEVRLDVADGAVVFEVIDKGIGVPKEAQKQLFTKFFRADNARKQRPDGTGIGLYLAKKVIDEHSGSVIFRSTEGKGSVFGFRLPIKKLSSPPEDNLKNLE